MSLARFNDMEMEVRLAKDWLSLLGDHRKEAGGGCGNFSGVSCNMPINFRRPFQAEFIHYPRATMQKYLNKVLLKHASDIADEAIQMMEAELAELAASALEEYKKLADLAAKVSGQEVER